MGSDKKALPTQTPLSKTGPCVVGTEAIKLIVYHHQHHHCRRRHRRQEWHQSPYHQRKLATTTRTEAVPQTPLDGKAKESGCCTADRKSVKDWYPKSGIIIAFGHVRTINFVALRPRRARNPQTTGAKPSTARCACWARGDINHTPICRWWCGIQCEGASGARTYWPDGGWQGEMCFCHPWAECLRQAWKRLRWTVAKLRFNFVACFQSCERGEWEEGE